MMSLAIGNLRLLVPSYVLKELGQTIIPVLEGASSENVPVEIEPIIQSVVDKAAPDARLTSVLFSSTQYNYSISRIIGLLASWQQQLRPDVTPTLDGHSYVYLSVPRIERDAVLMHAVSLGHELGHLRDWHLEITGRFQVVIPPQLLDAEGQATIQQFPRIDVFIRVARAWLGELVADTFAALLIGPAALLAFSELTGTLVPFEFDSPTHPAPDRRISVMLRVLREAGFDTVPFIRDLITEYENEVSNAFTRPPIIGGVIDAEPFQLAWEWVQGVLDDAIASCRSKVTETDEVFEPSRWNEVERAAQQLAGGLPHGEYWADGTLKRTSDRVILNAGWIVKLERLDALAREVDVDSSTSKGIQRVSVALNDLVLKSFEIAQYREAPN